jgi:hypothetical protein
MLAKTVGTGVGRAVSDIVANPSLTILRCFGFAAAVAIAFLMVAITAAHPEYPNDQAVLSGLSESTSISTSRTADGRERGRPAIARDHASADEGRRGMTVRSAPRSAAAARPVKAATLPKENASTPCSLPPVTTSAFSCAGLRPFLRDLTALLPHSL